METWAGADTYHYEFVLVCWWGRGEVEKEEKKKSGKSAFYTQARKKNPSLKENMIEGVIVTGDEQASLLVLPLCLQVMPASNASPLSFALPQCTLHTKYTPNPVLSAGSAPLPRWRQRNWRKTLLATLSLKHTSIHIPAGSRHQEANLSRVIKHVHIGRMRPLSV